MTNEIIVYTDGSALGNPGRGGWAYLVWDKKHNKINEMGGRSEHATNNQMELCALLNVLKHLQNIHESFEIVIFLDSDYVRNGITSWIHNWKKNSWRTANKKSVLNKELWVEIDEVMNNVSKKHKIHLKRVDAHTGIAGNEIVDQIAKSMAGNEPYLFFAGEKDEYEKLRRIVL